MKRLKQLLVLPFVFLTALGLASQAQASGLPQNFSTESPLCLPGQVTPAEDCQMRGPAAYLSLIHI